MNNEVKILTWIRNFAAANLLFLVLIYVILDFAAKPEFAKAAHQEWWPLLFSVPFSMALLIGLGKFEKDSKNTQTK